MRLYNVLCRQYVPVSRCMNVNAISNTHQRRFPFPPPLAIDLCSSCIDEIVVVACSVQAEPFARVDTLPISLPPCSILSFANTFFWVFMVFCEMRSSPKSNARGSNKWVRAPLRGGPSSVEGIAEIKLRLPSHSRTLFL